MTMTAIAAKKKQKEILRLLRNDHFLPFRVGFAFPRTRMFPSPLLLDALGLQHCLLKF